MTFFLGEKIDTPRRGPNVALPSNSDGVGAGFRTALRSVDQYIGLNATKDKEATPLALQAGERLGVEALHTYFADRAQQTMPGAQTPKYPDVQTYIDVLGADAVLNVAREKALADPEAWADMDIAPESIEAKAIERQKAEEAADQQLLALSPNPIRNSLVGALGAGVVDPINIAAAPLGLGAGSFLRVVGREMVIGATVEALQHPTRVKVAERLDQEAPNLAESMAIGALTGGVFAGVLDGIPRAMRAVAYYREMKKVEAAPDVTPATQEAAIQKAEAAISEGKPGAQAAADVILQEPAAPRRPLILDDSMRVQPEPTPLAPDPITTEPLAPVDGIPNTVDQIEAVAETGLAKAGPKGKQPKPVDLSTFVVRQGGIWKGDDRGEIAALEYKRPGFIKTTKFARSNAGDNGGGRTLDDMREMAAQAGYLDEGSTINDLLDALRDERTGNKRFARGEAGPTTRKTYDPDYVPERAWADPDPEQRGFLVNDLEARQFAEPETWRQTLEADVDRYLESKGAVLLPRERDEIMGVLATRGGDVEDMLYSAMSREIDEAEQAVIRSMRGEAYGRSDVPWGEETGMGPVPDRPGGSLAGEPETAPGDAAQLGARGVEPAVERTDIGDQYLIPDTRRVETGDAQRQKAELEARQLQSKIGRLNQARVEDDVDGLFAARSLDMFDDLSSPEAREFMDANIQGMRDILKDEGDFEVNEIADDGRRLTKLSDVLDEIDGDETLMREFKLCRLGGGTTE
jgi:hypothetical protein